MAFVKKKKKYVSLTIFCASEFYLNPASRMHKNVLPASQHFSQRKGGLIPRNPHSEYMHLQLVIMNIKV
jgi:hypothetical protein